MKPADKGNKSVAELRPLQGGRRLGDLPSILRSIPHLSGDDVSALGADIDAARKALASDKLRDPWAS